MGKSASYFLDPLKVFIKLHPNVPHSETVCRAHDSATKTKVHRHTSRSLGSVAGDIAVLQTAVLLRLHHPKGPRNTPTSAE